MKLILWRHASANTFNGYDRMLDPTGHKQAKQSAAWLKEKHPNAALWASLAKRAQETAQYFAAPESHHALNPGKQADDIHQYILTENTANELIVVGHLPWIEILAQQLAGQKQYFGFSHSMVMVFSSNKDGSYQLLETFQPDPVTG